MRSYPSWDRAMVFNATFFIIYIYLKKTFQGHDSFYDGGNANKMENHRKQWQNTHMKGSMATQKIYWALLKKLILHIYKITIFFSFFFKVFFHNLIWYIFVPKGGFSTSIYENKILPIIGNRRHSFHRYKITKKIFGVYFTNLIWYLFVLIGGFSTSIYENKFLPVLY